CAGGRSVTRGVTGTRERCSRLCEPVHMDRILCIVSRQHPELFAYLQHRFKDSMVSVILDRRMTARRRREIVADAEERRRDERRRMTSASPTAVKCWLRIANAGLSFVPRRSNVGAYCGVGRVS